MLRRSVNDLRTHIVTFLALIIRHGIQEVGEEENLEDAEYDEELDEYQQPKRLADGHASEAISIQMPYFIHHVLHARIINKVY